MELKYYQLFFIAKKLEEVIHDGRRLHYVDAVRRLLECKNL